MLPTTEANSFSNEINTMQSTPEHIQSPQASASTNSATRANDVVVDGISQEKGGVSSVDDVTRSDTRFTISRKKSSARYGCTDSAFVYFVRCDSHGPVKIGRTKVGVEARLTRFQIGCPYELTLAGAIWVANAEEVEAELHNRFRKRRVRGEWYLLTDSQVNAELLRLGAEPIERTSGANLELLEELTSKESP